jgi:hypothetical protein
MKSSILTVAAIISTLALDSPGEAAENFRQLTGAQIRASIVGMEITDEVHWAEVFAANGTLTSFAMSRKSAGKWHVQKDELCIDHGADDSGCYAVWLSGKNVELRRTGALPLQGVLQKPSARH